MFHEIAIHPMTVCNRKKKNYWRKVLEGKWSNLRPHMILWDECPELESYIRWNTTHDMYKLNGEVPKIIMFGMTSDTNQFYIFIWFEWAMFQDDTEPYPYDHFKLSKYQMQSIHVSPVLMAKVLIRNSWGFHMPMYYVITWDKWDNEENKEESVVIMESIHQRLGLEATVESLLYLGAENMPQHDQFQIVCQEEQILPKLDKEPE